MGMFLLWLFHHEKKIDLLPAHYFSLCLHTESLMKQGNWTDFQCKLWLIYSQWQPQVT